MGGHNVPGPPPKPTALKEAEGNPGKRRLNKLEPKPEAGDPVCPAHIKCAARTEWNRIIPLLRKMGVLTRVDGAALAAYCSAYSLWAKSEAEIQRRGVVIKTEFGPRKNPACQVRSSALREMKSFLTEFGMTPASRSRIQVGGAAGGGDDFDEFCSDAPALRVVGGGK